MDLTEYYMASHLRLKVGTQSMSDGCEDVECSMAYTLLAQPVPVPPAAAAGALICVTVEQGTC